MFAFFLAVFTKNYNSGIESHWIRNLTSREEQGKGPEAHPTPPLRPITIEIRKKCINKMVRFIKKGDLALLVLLHQQQYENVYFCNCGGQYWPVTNHMPLVFFDSVKLRNAIRSREPILRVKVKVTSRLIVSEIG